MRLPEWVISLPWQLIRNICEQFNVDHLLVASLIMVESSNQPCAMRYEPQWKYHFEIRTFAELVGTTVETEHMGQACSWGAMQVMGTTARELGFRGHFPELCDEEEGILYGVKYLKKKLDQYGDETDAIAAYNGGSVVMTKGLLYRNQTYVDKVHKYLTELRKL